MSTGTDHAQISREIDKKKKKKLLKTFMLKGLRGPFRAPIGQIVRVSPKSCNKLGLNKDLFH